MIRSVVVALAVLVAGGVDAGAQEWAQKMFDTTYHDFGAVARGSTVEFAFKLKNIYQETVHVVAVRSSCGCTTPKVEKDTLKTYEEGSIVASFNTRSFTGQKSATVTVTFDQPYYAEVQLQVTGYIRTDVVLTPPGVDFGAIDLGSATEKKVTLQYAGRDDWKLVGVEPHNDYLSASFVETARSSGQVTYEVTVRLKPDAPAGYMKEQLVLATNDQRAKEIPLDVQARITAPLTVSPGSLFLGALEPGQKVTKQVVVQSKRPFKIVAMKCADSSLNFSVSDEPRAVHVVPVTFTAGHSAGKITRKVQIETDLGSEVSAELSVYAQVVVPPAKS
ncbi:MAG TPA: DUF1573 domain-containing protein [Pirellulales bacterium]|nr:DUF1573 domain-containing protein [Pirellulales bacterium]